MSKQILDEVDDDRSTIKIVINDISTFLYKSGFLSKYVCDKKQIEILENNNKQDIIDYFEFKRAITSNDISAKYSDLLKSINNLFNTGTQYTYDSLYYQYIEYTKSNIPLNVFLNCLIMLNYIHINTIIQMY